MAGVAEKSILEILLVSLSSQAEVLEFVVSIPNVPSDRTLQCAPPGDHLVRTAWKLPEFRRNYLGIDLWRLWNWSWLQGVFVRWNSLGDWPISMSPNEEWRRSWAAAPKLRFVNVLRVTVNCWKEKEGKDFRLNKEISCWGTMLEFRSRWVSRGFYGLFLCLRFIVGWYINIFIHFQLQSPSSCIKLVMYFEKNAKCC